MEEEDISKERLVPVIEEELVTGTRAVKTGSVRIRKKVERIRKSIEIPTISDVVNVSRVPINRRVEAIPDIRQEGDVLIVPVVEEQIVVKKRLVLTEEIHIVRRKVETQNAKSVILGREHATVERLDSEGRVIATSKPRPKGPASNFKKHKSLLE
jgi:uncharacterized protein (TIGR02271 family)